jgi:hypothetical protein
MSTMRFTFTVEVEAERVQGKFASRDEIAEYLAEALSDANPSTFDADNGGEYEFPTWDVEVAETT